MGDYEPPSKKTRTEDPNNANDVDWDSQSPTLELSPGAYDTDTDNTEEQNRASLLSKITSVLAQPPEVEKVESVQRDTEVVATLIGDSGNGAVYQRLLNHRANPDRVAVVANELLDETPVSGPLSGPPEPEKNGNLDRPSSPAAGTSSGDTVGDLFSDVQTVIDRVKSLTPDYIPDPNEVYEVLEQHVNAEDRVALTVGVILGRSGNKGEKMWQLSSQSSSNASAVSQNMQDPLFKHVREVVKMFPSKDRKVVFRRLKELDGDANPVNTLCNEFLKEEEAKTTALPKPSSTKVELEKADSDAIPEMFKKDPLYRDMLDVVRVFPKWDRNEVYAFLEANYYKHNRKQLVIEELMPRYRDQDSQAGSLEGASGGSQGGSQKKEEAPQLTLLEEVQYLKAIVPDCEPNFLFDKLEALPADPERVHKVAEELLSSKNYPKLSELQEQKKRQELKQRLSNLTFDMTEFLRDNPNPAEYFYNEGRSVSENYKEHALAQLLNYFPVMTRMFISEVLQQHKGHFPPALKHLKEEAATLRRRDRHKFQKKPRQTEQKLPADPDEPFFRELLFTQHEEEIAEHQAAEAKAREQRLEEARASGSLHTCGCCYDDEVLWEDMRSCPAGHLFCVECVKRSTETNIGDGKAEFPCLAEGCEVQFSLEALQQSLAANIFSRLLKKVQEKEINSAGIENLVTCPFCPFATIMENPDNRILRCRNPECMKESCRECGEASHIPLRCSEVERRSETNMRTFIENKIAEAMIRTCWSCKKRFLKDFGCNKMTCTCGASMCYVCQKPIQGYEHFGDGPDLCPVDTDVYELHRKEMEAAGVTAKTEYLEAHPEAQGVSLAHDPLRDIEKMRKGQGRPRMGFGLGPQFGVDELDDEEYDAEDGSDEDDY